MDVNVTEVALGDLRDFAERTFRPLAHDRALEFGVEIVGANVPPAIETDEQRLQQVLKNLLSNALKFTEEGSVTLRVGLVPDEYRFASTTLEEAGQVLAFAVSDTGIGIPEDKLRLIFEAFQQADGSTARRYGGTGLGLSISREIARLLGGEIRAESREGAGSTFTLFLPAAFPPPHAPVADEDADAPTAAEAAELEAVLAPDLDPALLLPGEVEDDRDDVQPGDRTVLIVEDDADLARTVLDAARERGFKGIVALRGDSGLALAHELRPDAIVLDIVLPVLNGWTVLDRLKRHPDTRHIPVHVLSGGDGRQHALRAGAVSFVEKPASRETLDDAFSGISEFIARGVRRLLVIEDDELQREAIVRLVGTEEGIEIETAASSDEALARLEEQRFDCVVLDLKLPGTTGFQLLEQVKKAERHRDLPIIVYTGKDLTRREETRLRRYAESIIVKDARSPERLLDETSLFLHRVESRLPDEKRRMLEQLHSTEDVFTGKMVLIVDDDVRNVFALTSVLEDLGVEVIYAENGRDALATLDDHPDLDLVLMDIMMPELDGYETMEAIRSSRGYEQLPIISLTAKAMKGDREKSIASGASDYIAKPVDVDQLLSLMRVWLYR
jgi:CheY-like chemotaxis protein